MELLKETACTVDRLLGHGDNPVPVSLPLAAWTVAIAGDGLAMATGNRGFEAAARYAIGAGLISSAGSMITGIVERRSGEVTAEEHPAGVTAHAAGALAVGGLFAASLFFRVQSASRHERPSALARGLALAGGALAMANALLTNRMTEDEYEGADYLISPAPVTGPQAARF